MNTNLEICASRYLRGVFLYHELKRTNDDKLRQAISEELFGMFEMKPEEMEVIKTIIEPMANALEPSEDE
jgi:hypothetical protein